MSRTSVNTERDGYDYDAQAWVVDGIYQDCGHVQNGKFCCNAHQLAGQTAWKYLEQNQKAVA